MSAQDFYAFSLQTTVDLDDDPVKICGGITQCPISLGLCLVSSRILLAECLAYMYIQPKLHTI